MWSIDNGPRVDSTIAQLGNGAIDLQHINPYDAVIFQRLMDENRKKGLFSITLKQGIR